MGDSAIREERIEPKVDMIFDTDNAALSFYQTFAKQKGFGVVKSNSKKQGTIQRYITLACHRSSKPKKNSDPRQTTKTDCKAKVNIVRQVDDRWKISKVILEHNHALDPEKSIYLKCYRTRRQVKVLHSEASSTTMETHGHDVATLAVQGNNSVHMRKRCDSGVDHVIDGADPAPIRNDPCAQKNDSGDKVSMKSDYFLSSDDEPFVWPSSVECGPSQLASDFENFKIIVNKSVVDPELPNEMRKKYFDLCSERKDELHSQFLPTIDAKLAAEIISQTTKISELIRNCNLETCEDLDIWDATLIGFEALGMKVAFMRARINRLRGLVLDSKKKVDKKRYREVVAESHRIKEQIEANESKIMELKKAKTILMNESEEITATTERYKTWFREAANASWLF